MRKRTHTPAQAPWSPEAFAELYDRYLPRVYAYVAYRVPHTQDVEDLVSESFFRAIRGQPQFEPQHEGAFAAWLFRIAHNLVVDFYRRGATQATPLSLDQLPELHSANPTPEDLVSQEELFVRLRRLIAQLPARRQEIITLKFFGQLRNQAIADILGLDERTVASHLCRGLRDLHQYFDTEPHQTESRSADDEHPD